MKIYNESAKLKALKLAQEINQYFSYFQHRENIVKVGNTSQYDVVYLNLSYDCFDFFIRFADKNSYFNVSKILQDKYPFNLEFYDSVINSFIESLTNAYQIEKGTSFSKINANCWNDFMPSKRSIKFNSQFAVKDTILYLGVDGRKHRLITHSRLAVLTLDDGTTKPVVYLNLPLSAYSNRSLKVYISTQEGDKSIYMLKNKKTISIELNTLLKFYEETVDVTNYNMLVKTLGKSISLKEYKSLSLIDKEDHFLLSQMTNI